MRNATLEIRPLHQQDFDAVVAIDENVFSHSRPEYYEAKFTRALNQKDHLVTSFVAETDGRVVGFIMSELFVGEYGIPDTTAQLDTIGVDPDYQGKGVSLQLMETFISHLRKAGVEKVSTLVDWNDWQLTRFFSKIGFEPAKKINLELKL